MLDAARDYVGRGWSVIPVGKKTKLPVVKWKEYQSRPPREDELTEWFSDDRYNIGIVTGGVSDLSVLDIDEITPEWTQLMFAHDMPETLTVRTGKGEHLYFRGGADRGNSVRSIPGVDVRSEGGYVVAPPSLHGSGVAYEFTSETNELAEWPEWLDVVPGNGHTAVSTALPPTEGTQYGRAAFEGILRELPGTMPGVRNRTLFEKSWKVGRLVAEGKLGSPEGAKDALTQIGAEDLEQGWAQARATVDSGFAKGIAGAQLEEDDEDSFGKPITALLNGASSHVWVAKKWVPGGLFSVLTGQQKVGKGLFWIKVAADITRGNSPGSYRGNPRPVIISCTEDDYVTDVIPRFQMAGGDITLLHYIEPHHQMMDERSLRGLEQFIRETGAVWVVLDQLSDHIPRPSGSESWQNQDGAVRPYLVGLHKVAKSTGAGVTGILHDRKGYSQGLEGVAGAQAWTAVARVILRIERKNDASYGKIKVIGNNVGPKAKDKVFVLERKEIEGEQVPYLRWPQKGEPLESHSRNSSSA